MSIDPQEETSPMSTAQIPTLDMNKLNAFIGQFVTDLGAAVHTGMVVIGEKLGLYKALAGNPMNSAQLAAKTKTDERYLREWLASQAAGGYNKPSLWRMKTVRPTCPEHSNWHWVRWRRFHGSWKPSAQATAWVGMNTLMGSSTVARSSFVQGTPLTS
jgi:hypothetical protein